MYNEIFSLNITFKLFKIDVSLLIWSTKIFSELLLYEKHDA